MLTRRLGYAAVLFATLATLGSSRTAAASANLGLGADWVQGGNGELNLTLGADTRLARFLSVGGRAGVAFFGDSNNIAVPVDLRLRAHVQRLYFEGLAGPWFMIDGDKLFDFHGAFGFGIETGGLELGLEVGRLRQTTLLGLRLAFRL
jgi:hypothetical protein